MPKRGYIHCIGMLVLILSVTTAHASDSFVLKPSVQDQDSDPDPLPTKTIRFADGSQFTFTDTRVHYPDTSVLYRVTKNGVIARFFDDFHAQDYTAGMQCDTELAYDATHDLLSCSLRVGTGLWHQLDYRGTRKGLTLEKVTEATFTDKVDKNNEPVSITKTLYVRKKR